MTFEHYVPLLIVVFFAFTIPIVISKIKKFSIPIVIGELVVGFIIGQSGFNIIQQDDPWLEFLRFLGFAFLMFLSGIEVDFEHLLHPEIKKSIKAKVKEKYINKRFTEEEKELIPENNGIKEAPKLERIIAKSINQRIMKHRVHRHWNFSDLDISNKPYLIGVVSYLLTLGLSISLMILLAFFHQPMNFLFLGVMFSTTSVGIVFPILFELKLSESEYGQSILIVSIIADFVSMVLITILSALFAQDVILVQFLLVPLVFIIFISCFQAIKILKKHPKWYSKLVVKEKSTTEIKVTGSLFMLIIFIFLSEVFGIEMILGAFIAGILISLISPYQKAKELHEKLHGIGYGFFIPIFFIMVGAEMKIEELFSNWISIALGLTLIGIAFFVKILPNYILYRKKYGARASIASGILQSSRLSLIIASAEIGYLGGFLSKTIFESAVLIAIITSVLSPILFSYLNKKEKREEITK
ncbi:MAG: cation:proton antiporter [Candidatus Lokiarchaeota archaeon]|nr:cation:proton antiporter [Candidatus Lokiarchaeota archaeon]